MPTQENTTQEQVDKEIEITPKLAMDALLKICNAKDGLYPYTCCKLEPGVSAGLTTALEVMSANFEIVYDFISQAEDQQKEAQT